MFVGFSRICQDSLGYLETPSYYCGRLKNVKKAEKKAENPALKPGKKVSR